jgi:carbonic anhydrase
VAALVAGNAVFAELGTWQGGDRRHVIPLSAEDLGLGVTPGAPPTQHPWAAVLSCADARVPTELVFTQSANDVFVVRVAGNVLGSACVGSLDFAVSQLPTLRLLAVVGHTGCGAVSAAVDAFLRPAGYLGLTANLPLRSIVDQLVATVRGAAVVLAEAYGDDVVTRAGYRAALVDLSVVLHAALAADALQRLFAPALGDALGVAFGVYDLVARRVGLPDAAADADGWRGQLAEPLSGPEFLAFAAAMGGSGHVRRLLDGIG